MKTILDKLRPADIDRFHSKVESGDPNQCWPWKGAPVGDGYGHLQVVHEGKKVKLATHRVALTLKIGEEIPEGKSVLHSCDNSMCCNPNHLRAGTHDENMEDMVTRNRAAVSFGPAKLNWDKVDEIRSSNLSNVELARMYDVSPSAISEIKNNKTWQEDKRDITKGIR